MKNNITITQIFSTTIINDISDYTFTRINNFPIPAVFTTTQKIIPETQLPPTLKSIIPPKSKNLVIKYAPPILESEISYYKLEKNSPIGKSYYEDTLTMYQTFIKHIALSLKNPDTFKTKNHHIHLIQNPDDISLQPFNLTKQELLEYFKKGQFVFYKTKQFFYHIIGYASDYTELQTLILGYYNLSEPFDINTFASLYLIEA